MGEKAIEFVRLPLTKSESVRDAIEVRLEVREKSGIWRREEGER